VKADIVRPVCCNQHEKYAGCNHHGLHFGSHIPATSSYLWLWLDGRREISSRPRLCQEWCVCCGCVRE
jgi:hypothetical protein